MLILVVLLSLLNLLKEFHYASLSDSFGFYIIQLRPIFMLSLISFHGKSFSTSSLPIRKNCSVVPFHHLGNETRNA